MQAGGGVYYASSGGAHASFTMLGGGIRSNSVAMDSNGFGGECLTDSPVPCATTACVLEHEIAEHRRPAQFD